MRAFDGQKRKAPPDFCIMSFALCLDEFGRNVPCIYRGESTKPTFSSVSWEQGRNENVGAFKKRTLFAGENHAVDMLVHKDS